MKRYISLLLVAVVLITGLAVPSYAAEPLMYDVLESYTLNDSGSNFFYCDGNTNRFYINGDFKYLDFVIRFTTYQPQTPQCTVWNPLGDSRLNAIRIDDYTFRYYGFLNGRFESEIAFAFTEGLTPGYSEFLSFKVSSFSFAGYNLPLNGYVVIGDGDEQNFHFNNWDDYSGVNIFGSSDFNYDDYTVYSYIHDWKKYDYIDLHLLFLELSVSSIGVYCDGVSVPFTVDYINSENSRDNLNVSLMIDLTSINRLSDGALEVIVEGAVPVLDGRLGRFTVMNSTGFVLDTHIGENATFFYRLRTFLSSSFNNLFSAISSQTDRLHSIISEHFIYLNGWMSEWGHNLRDSINSVGSKIETWGQNIVSSVASVGSKIEIWGQNIVDALSPDTDAASSAVDKADQQASQVQQNNEALQQMAKPDLNGAGDISGIISVTDTARYTLFLNRIMTAPVISDVIMLSLIFSLAGYVLFGKRD